MTNELKWPEVETWLNSNPRTTRVEKYLNSYNTDCPVRKHPSRLRVWDGDDGHIGLKCFGGCAPRDVHTAITAAIKTGAPSVTEPPPVTKPQIEALEQERAARQKAETERDQAHAARLAAEKERDQALDDAKEVETLRGEKSSLKNRLIAANARVSQVDTQLGVRIRVILLEERIKELAAGQGKSIHHEIRVRELQKELDDTKARAERLEKSNREIQNKKDGLEKQLETAKENEILRDQDMAVLDSHNDDLWKENSSAKNKLLRRDKRISDLETRVGELEPKAFTIDFLASWSRLEGKMRPLKHELIRNGQRSDMADQLRLAHQKGRINKHQFMNLETMREQRNDVVHHALPLTITQALANLDILKQIIDQL